MPDLLKCSSTSSTMPTAFSTMKRRAEITEDLGLGEALDRYIDNSADLQEHRHELKNYALQLERELDLGEATEANDV